MQEFIERIRAALVTHSGLAADDVKIESPRDPELGDFAFPCFPLAKIKKAPPPKIAAELVAAVQADLEGVTVQATGPYLNFRIDRTALASTVLGAIETQAQAYGGGDDGAGKTIVLDFSSPNIAKPFHVGHLRSTIIGAAVKRLHDVLGYRTVGINHIGDWGAQFGKLITAIRRWAPDEDFSEEPINKLFALYVRYHEEESEDATLEEQSRKNFQELESGVEGEVRATWKRLTELSLAEFDKSYERLGVTFDFVRGESFYEPLLDQTVDRIVSAGVTEESQGALIVRLDEFEKDAPPCLLRKTDGTTLYATRDLAALFHRWDEFQFDRALYVVGSEQRLHFRQLKNVLRRMEVSWVERVEHVDFGRLLGMSTRKGNVIFLDQLLDAAVEKTRQIIAEKNPDLADKGAVAEAVGCGAVVFNDLKKERVKDVVFEWDDVLAFDGDTGPYVQYTHARLCSILRKAPITDTSPDFALLEDSAGLILTLGRFPAVVRSAARRAEPFEVAQYVLGLCREMNSWYVDHRVLGDDAALSAARLTLVRGVKIVIGNGLGLLGLAAPEEM